VSSTMPRHSISRSLLTTWRRQFRVQVPGEAEAGLEFVPAVVVPEASGRPIAVSSSSRMEIVTANGRRIIVDAGLMSGLWVAWCTCWSGTDHLGAGRGVSVAGQRGDRHGARDEQPGLAGAAGAGARPAWR
jgi:hypothetical protein